MPNENENFLVIGGKRFMLTPLQEACDDALDCIDAVCPREWFTEYVEWEISVQVGLRASARKEIERCGTAV